MSKVERRADMGGVRKTRNKVKATTSKLLALFMAAVLVCSTLGSIAAVADTQGTASGSADATDCGIGGSSYESTNSLDENDKSNDTQKNVQETTDVTDYSIADALYQSAEWTNKATGEAEINIHYEADLSNADPDETRSLYVFTPCTAHGLDRTIVVSNIVTLLGMNDYVDVVMIATMNTTKSGDAGAFTVAMTFSMCAADFIDSQSGDIDEEFATQEISDILAATTSSSLANETYAYGLGQTKDSSTTGSIDVLYVDEGYTSSTLVNSNDALAAHALQFEENRHAGFYFSPYYIQKYIDIIEERSLIFDTTVQYIINSFDGFIAAHRNTYNYNSAGYTYLTDSLYANIEDLVGLDFSDEDMSLQDLTDSDVADAIETIRNYDTLGRYVVLTPSDSQDNSIWTVSNAWKSRYTDLTDVQIVNDILYTMFLMDPSDTWDYESSVRAQFASDITSTGTTYSTSGVGSYTYGTDLATLGILNISPDKRFRIVATITSEFELITDSGGEADITVSNLSGSGTSFSYTVSPSGGNGSNTVVTITITDLNADSGAGGLYDADDNPGGVSEWIIDVSIPVKLVAGTMSFRDTTDDEDAFKATNAADTSATVYAENTGGGEDYIYETVTVASPKLYRLAGALTIFKTVEDASDTTTEFDFEVTLPSSVSGTFYYYTDDPNDLGSITFTEGAITAVDDDPDTTTIPLTHGESFTIVGLLTDVAYTVTESAATGYSVKSIGVEASSSSSSSGFTEATDSELSDGGYYVDTATRTATTKILAADETVTVAYTNVRTFTLTIYKYTGDDDETDTPGTGLDGAVFSVVAVSGSDDTADKGGATASGGKLVVSGLEVGAVYKISEEKVPSGYTYDTLQNPIYIKVAWDNSENKLVGYVVTSDGDYTYEEGASVPTTLTVASDGSFIIKVRNTQIESLPQTGGSGTLYIFASGIALMALAAYALYCQRRGMRTCAAHAAFPYQARASRPYVSHAVASPWQARAASRPQPTRRRTQ